MLEQIIISLISGSIIGIVGTYIVIKNEEQRQKLELNELKKKYQDLEAKYQSIPSSSDTQSLGISTDLNDFLNSLDIRINSPREDETIIGEQTIKVEGEIKNLPKGLTFDDLGLFIVHTRDGQGYWPQGAIEPEITIDGNATFKSLNYINHDTDILLVSAGEKSKGAFNFYKQCCHEGVFEKAENWVGISKQDIRSDLKVLSRVSVKFSKG